MGDFLYTLTAILTIVFPAFNILAWWILRSATKMPKGKNIKALRERKNAAAILAIASMLLGILGWNRLTDVFFGFRVVDTPIPLLIIALVVILVSLPSLIFLIRYYRNGFDDSDSG